MLAAIFGFDSWGQAAWTLGAVLLWSVGWLVGPMLMFLQGGLGSAGGRPIGPTVALYGLVGLAAVALVAWLTWGDLLVLGLFVAGPPLALLLLALSTRGDRRKQVAKAEEIYAAAVVEREGKAIGQQAAEAPARPDGAERPPAKPERSGELTDLLLDQGKP